MARKGRTIQSMEHPDVRKPFDFRIPAGDALIERGGFRVVRFGSPESEFPAGCVAAYIDGPALAAGGLPFCVPEVGKEIWARRWCLALAGAFEAGRIAKVQAG
jgi:hypothetical protein